MGLSKTEINFRRLLAAAPHQQNQAKLMHYVATLREQLEQLAQETTPDGLPRISKAKVNDYSEKIEAIVAKLSAPVTNMPGSPEDVGGTQDKEIPRAEEGSGGSPSAGLRRRFLPPIKSQDRTHEISESDQSTPIKLDAAAQSFSRGKAQTVGIPGTTAVFVQVLDSTERAVESSLASTGHANKRAMQIFSESSKTSCLTWLVMFVMTCIFVMVVLLIRVT
ncbi:uncharacterized protein LOC122070378 [Macadamia integrifolia]|uniref:uncharacterized protein LOC122070378 n=1 Tax=Macadamia integrifolia TaxID=60698 RepID=UPI001C4F94A8|nr:uncharacterized protein LOC122070378 [Macadamia integrifolia]